eukprot:GILK01001343.1.p1 GENE.GILK01001343.1~~GILK01001343.1.p1  ORF type:complete len:1083 (-),score=209.41 GILK01001343.1:77-3274(-)
MAENEPRSFARRDHLLEIEAQIQQLWEDQKAYETDAPDESAEKFMVTFPYPYMNGRLHLGHAFSLTKAEFAARYHQLKGKKVLFPFGFHCTGMPIAACADKLKRIIEERDNPSAPADSAGNEEEEVEESAAEATAEIKDPSKFQTKKSKVAAKTGGENNQWKIMQSMGVPEEEIPKFANSRYWLDYFPPYGKMDLQRFGCAIDWRRSFITTEVNPFYDSFIRWQFEMLRERGKIQFGKRHTIFSPRDNQPCADHDRQTGEGVGPQEYTLIKLRVLELSGPLAPLEGKDVFLVAATLRPETMYGQTNCFVLPTGTYGAFQINDNDVFICSRRSAINMAYQGLSPVPNKEQLLLEVKGQDLIGVPLRAPNAVYERVYALPMTTISMDKGTGVVTSVPSDAPDDYAALRDLQTKQGMRDLFKVKEEWCVPFAVVPIIDIPGFGNQAAVKVCEDMKIQSQKDKDKLALAKNTVYLKGFTEGIMLVGSQAGQKVSQAKAVVRQELIESGEAVSYWEPEKKVMSRSGDECVVALCDQWYLKYGEADWRAAVEAHLKTFETYNPMTQKKFEDAVDWLKEWACSRSYGLGTHLPWDTQFVIESLSDSTIYMAYYAVAHLLQGGVLDGSALGPLGIRAEQLTAPVWNYIFLQGPYPADCGIEEAKLQELRKEFEFWYPMDLRCSGKDLIANHLTMSLYNHAAIWENQPNKWPRSFFTNGHVMVDGEKMSKSLGNFLTTKDAVELYSADVTRLALADAGDSLDDANFESKSANAAILRLTTFEQWIEKDVLGKLGELRTGELTHFADKVFANQINKAIQQTDVNYGKMMFRDALHSGLFDFMLQRDDYRVALGAVPFHKDLILRYVEVQLVLLTPICPHFCEYVWGKILKKQGLIVHAAWPTITAPFDPLLDRCNKYLHDMVRSCRLALTKRSGNKKGEVVSDKPNGVVIYVAREYPEWKQSVLRALQKLSPEQLETQWSAAVKEVAGTLEKKMFSKAMQFASFVKDDAVTRGADALELRSPFDEKQILLDNSDFLQRSFDFAVKVCGTEDPNPAEDASNRREEATPGKPVYVFF